MLFHKHNPIYSFLCTFHSFFSSFELMPTVRPTIQVTTDGRATLSLLCHNACYTRNDSAREGGGSLFCLCLSHTTLTAYTNEFRFDHFGGRSNFFVAPLGGYKTFLPSQCSPGLWIIVVKVHAFVSTT